VTSRGRAILYGLAGVMFGLASLRQLLAAIREADPQAKLFPAAYAVVFLLLCGSCLVAAVSQRKRQGDDKP
jgi:hypothetical protein